ncbi:acyl-CoA reductase [Blattabacterium cuenoti]|uniref:acyl-CoA reductase n=1 Tax=Blattabacterium cuenoti TaxID=1653831 RepID=UPI00163B7C06|nr:acyl-CoA reductase [Blattabacterium cuenoti]
MNTLIRTFDKLGFLLKEFKEFYTEKNNFSESKKNFFLFMNYLKKISDKNTWFRIEDLLITIEEWSILLRIERLEEWINKYSFEKKKKKTVLVIMPGNIPIAGFHDFLCVILSGHRILIKLSKEDDLLFPFLCNIITYINPSLKKMIKFSKNFSKEKYDIVIASGSTNTARYFEYYFRDYPLLLRKSRTSIAILQGDESNKDLVSLTKDILTYSGRGCRNVGKIFVPNNYDFRLLLVNMTSSYIMKNPKYVNNYNYYHSIYTMNNIPMKKNNIIILIENKKLFSPISVIYYEFYSNLNKLKNNISNNREHLQCIVSKNIFPYETYFGNTQYPNLLNYSDGFDTMKFINQ